MDKIYNYDQYLGMSLDFSVIVNSTLDLKPGSILCIDNEDIEKLDYLINEALNKDVDKILTSSKSKISDDKVYRFEDYEKVFEDILKNINPNFKNKTFFGITGTNGKTTTAHLLNSLLGDSSIFVGTIDEDNLFEFTKEEHLTTPKLFNLVKMLSLIDRDVSNVVLEVSSHALDQKRLNGLYFKMSGFTNLSQDHLDYHNTMDEYFEAKTKLFNKKTSEDFAYIDSIYGEKLNQIYDSRGFSIGNTKNNNVQLNSYTNDSIDFDIDGINYAKGDIIVDYSHTPEAIEKVIKYTKERYKKDVIVVFGAGGNRDKSKRKFMGTASQNAEKIIITNDNPRKEDQLDISKQILEGIDLKKNVEIILNRREAISKGVKLLDGKSTLLVLGKGHEKFQEIGDELYKFDDIEVVREEISI
jgi:UDP-N-acetylmuramoyl-L-alanyl-D-glutamate--2,6-diaminopimelate ligase